MSQKINILTTAWNRHPDRFNYFKKMVLSVKEKIDWGEYIPEWIVSIEKESHYRKEEMEDFCKEENLLFYYHPNKRGLGRNTNYGYSLCKNEVILFIQDDCLAVEPLEIWRDIDWFLLKEKYGVLRYYAHFDRDNNNGHMKLVNKDLELYEIHSEAPYYMNFHVHLRKQKHIKLTGPYNEEFKFKSKEFPEGIDGGVAENSMVRQAREVSNIMGIVYKRCPKNIKQRSYGNYFGKQKISLEVSTLKEKQLRIRNRRKLKK